eukprot:CAMPEP_0172676514 /NCGR_PEP_ID=MMETSP1074-20121228/14041_1 /TAXON_ID=2916 /ORGANISM="Ceratium fusus, Strain PA161109" /LENGTH=233 /DNA_ID=CAMNT_0013494195 /DNA_START=119 /DNA_END=820 /DNA_ORIENTATION=-
MAASAVICWGMHRSSSEMLRRRDYSRDTSDKAGAYVTAGVHGLIASLLAMRALMFDEVIVKDPLYGRSDATLFAFALSAGFFIYDVVLCFANPAWGLDATGHAIAGLLLYVIAQFPFTPRMACLGLLFELSTPMLNAFKLLQLLADHRTQLIQMFQALFALTFWTVRLGLGIPWSVRFWHLILSALAEGRHHSTLICLICLAANIGLNFLTVFWSYKIARLAMRGGKKRSNAD